MILLDEIIQILALANLNGYLPTLINLIDSRFVRPTFVHRDLLGLAIVAHGLFEELSGCCLIALGCQQKVDRFASLIDCSIEIFPDALTLM